MKADNCVQAICTITTASYQRQAACMLDSYLRRHPHGRCFILHVDEMQSDPFLDRPEITRLRLAEIQAPGLAAMRARYTQFELCNALKPFLLRYLFQITTLDRLCYFDGDIFFFDSLQTAVWDELQQCSILITPHLIRLPDNDPDLIWRDLAVLQHGVYNGGFIGLRRGPDADLFLQWWGERTRHLGQKKLEEGLNCDQRWLDLLPGFDLDHHISRHPGLNAAYWNLHERKFEARADSFTANGQPLIFFHFSGYSPDRPDVITRHFTHFDLAQRPDLQPIFAVYHQALLEHTSAGRAAQPLAAPPPSPDSSDRSREIITPSSLTVSVIIPAFNAGRYVAAAIDSVLAQTLDDLEIIVVDDGSTDDTGAIVSKYALEQGERVRLLHQVNAGVSAARNRGIQAARGECIAFLDADDWYLHPSKLADQAAILSARPKVGIVHSGWRLVDEQGAFLAERRPWLQAPVLDLEGWLLWQPALPSAMMVRRAALLEVGGFDAQLAHAEDLDLALRLTTAGYATAWLKEVTVAYRQHEHNATRRLSETEGDVEQVLTRFFSRPDLPETIPSLEPRVRFGSLCWLAVQYYRAGTTADMARILRSSLSLRSLPSPAAHFFAWLDSFEYTLREEFGERFDAYALTSQPEWQSLVRSQLFGQTLDGASGFGHQIDLGLTRLTASLPRPAESSTTNPSPDTSIEPKLDLANALTRDYGRHRSGWAYALRSLMPLHKDGGVWVDAFVEHSFDETNPARVRPHTRPWVGFLHNPPNMPDWFVYNQSPQSLLNNKAFIASLPHCRGLFCLSEHLADWWRERLDLPISVLRLPTLDAEPRFSIERFAANPEKRIVQAGAWLRKLNSIFFLPVRKLKRTIVHQHRPYIDNLMAQERTKYNLRPNDAGVEILPYLDDEAYDALLASNMMYMELYDSSANNVIVECITRATPLLVNPLPAVIEYLGKDYPFYFSSREQAARKAETMALIEQTHHYLLAHPLRPQLTGDAFAQALASSTVYERIEV